MLSRAGVALGTTPVIDAFTVQAFTTEWRPAGGGDWNTAANWTGGAVPGVSDSAYIGTRLPVVFATGTGELRLLADSNGELDVTGGTLTVDQTTNLGNATLHIGGGTFTTTGAATIGRLIIDSGALAGAGAVTVGALTMSGGVLAAGGTIVAGAGSTTALTGGHLERELDIGGAGSVGSFTVGGDGLPGVLQVLSTGTLVLAGGLGFDGTAGDTVRNAGTISSAGGTLTGVTIDGTGGGTILATGALSLVGTTLIGGTVATLGAGVIQLADRGSTLNGVSIVAGAVLTIVDNQAATARGTLTNNGVITLASVGNYTALNVSGPVVLAGAGVLQMQAGNSLIQGAGTLTSSSTIQGAGTIGQDTGFTFVNSGLVDANSATQALIVGTDAAPVVNTGTLQSSAAGGLLIRNQAVTNTGGTIQALAGGTVLLQNSTITGGTLATAGTGVIITNDRNSVLDGVTITAGNTVTIRDNQALTLLNTNNQANYVLASVGNYTALLVNGQVGLSNSTITMRAGNSIIQGAGTLTSSSTIQGAGTIGQDLGFTFVNSGLVDANVTTQELIIGTDKTAVANTGTLRASAGAVLLIRNQTVANAGGTIRALDGGTVLLLNSTITGGTLATAGTGVIITNDRSSVLDGVLVTAGTSVRVQDNQALSTAGSVTVAGTLALTSVGNYTALILSGTTTITGALTLSDAAANQINGAGTATTLANAGLIQGAGQIGTADANVSLTNSGTIDANGGNALRINTGAAQISNTGTLQGTGGGGLNVSSAMLNAGLVWARTGPVFLAGAVRGTGQEKLSGAAQLELGSAVSAGQTITFDTGATGTLRLDTGAAFAGTIAGFRAGAAVDLADFQFNASFATSYLASSAGGTLRVTDGTQVANLALTGAYSASSFTASNDGAGHVLLRTSA